MSSEPLLQVRDLRVYYGKAEILKGVSLDVEEGSIVAIVGANGAGKTTLLRTVSGLKKPTAGSIRYRGHAIDHLAPNRIARLGVIHVPEGRQVFAPMSVEDNLRVGGHMQRERGATSRDMERMFGLFPVLREKRTQAAGTLSGG